MTLTREIASEYYRRVSSFLLYHLKNVPVSFKRYPDALDGESFWEKDAPGFTPEWVRTFAVSRRDGESDIHYVLINDERTLLWIAEIGGIEIHPFLHRAPHIDRPTSIVFDLDPGEGATLDDCREVALLLRQRLERESFVKVSGSKGMQVYIPAEGDVTHKETEAYARAVAEELARKHPSKITAVMAKAQRAGKVFIDYSQNADYKTTVAVYSLRATGRVSMPVTWREVETAQRLEFGPEEAVARLAEVGDLWRSLGVSGSRRSVAKPRETTRLRDLPKPRSQSGRRLFVRSNSELWLEMGGTFRCWNLSGRYEGESDVDPAYYRGAVPKGWRAGSYELMRGSFARGRMELWLDGKQWTLARLTGLRWRLSL
jgi:bifunctional non-homologous end joining protein LigD